MARLDDVALAFQSLTSGADTVTGLAGEVQTGSVDQVRQVDGIAGRLEHMRQVTGKATAAARDSAAAGEALAHLRPRPVMRVRQRLAARLAPAVSQCGSWLEHAPYGPRRNPRATAGRRY